MTTLPPKIGRGVRYLWLLGDGADDPEGENHASACLPFATSLGPCRTRAPARASSSRHPATVAASFEFAESKPIELLSGANLLYLLAEHAGIEARIIVPEQWHDPTPDEDA
jgi:hypothetical protein